MKSPYFKFYVQDFLQGVRHFSAEETGAYILMLCEQWDAGFIDNDEDFLKKISRISEKKRKKVDKKFQETSPGHLQNSRLEIERNKYKEFCNKQASNGSKGGRRARNNNPTLNPNESQKEPNANPTLNPNESLSLSGNTNVLPMSESESNEANASWRSPVEFQIGPRRSHPTPTYQQVAEYFAQQGIYDESRVKHFFNRYEAVGWTINGAPITSAKALVTSWLSNPISQAEKKNEIVGRKVIMVCNLNGKEEIWPEAEYEQYRNNPVAGGYKFLRYEL